MSWSRPTVGIFHSCKSVRTERDAVLLMGSESFRVLRVLESSLSCYFPALTETTSQNGRLFEWQGAVYQDIQHKVIQPHDNAPLHSSLLLHNYLKSLNCEVLDHLTYSPRLSLGDCHMSSTLSHALKRRQFILYKTWKMPWREVLLNDRRFFITPYTVIFLNMGKCQSCESEYFKKIWFFACYEKWSASLAENTAYLSLYTVYVMSTAGSKFPII